MINGTRNKSSLVIIGIVSLTIFVSSCETALATSPVANDADLEIARSAAKAFCKVFKFPRTKMRKLNGPPISRPSTFKDERQTATAYRWLGGGRGDYAVQVRFYHASKTVVVYGGYDHKEFGRWLYEENVTEESLTAWQDAASATNNPAEITIAPTTPGDPERIMVRAVLLKNNEPVGIPSDPTYVTVNP